MLIRRWWLPPSWPHCPHPLWCSTLPLHPQVTSLPFYLEHTCSGNSSMKYWLIHCIKVTHFKSCQELLTLSQVKQCKSLDVSLPRHWLICWVVYVLIYIHPKGRESYSIISTSPLSLYTWMLTQARPLLPTVQPWPHHHSSFCCFQCYCGCHHHANLARRSKLAFFFFFCSSALN